MLDVCDVYVTFRRSLDPSLVWFQRFRHLDFPNPFQRRSHGGLRHPFRPRLRLSQRPGLVPQPEVATFFGLVTLADRSASTYNDAIPDSWRLRYLAPSATSSPSQRRCRWRWGQQLGRVPCLGPAPTDPKSCLRISNIHTLALSAPECVVRWPSVLGKQYVLESSLTLFAPNWMPVSTNSGSGADVIFQTPLPPTLASIAFAWPRRHSRPGHLARQRRAGVSAPCGSANGAAHTSLRQHLSRKRELLGCRPLAGLRSVAAPAGAAGAARLDLAPARSGNFSAVILHHFQCLRVTTGPLF